MNSLDFAQQERTTLIDRRRELHRHPEPAWLEYRTAAFAADVLTDLGFSLKVGKDVVATASRMGLPTEEEMKESMDRAIAEGANPKWVEAMAYGHTGIVATMVCGNTESPIVAFRADIDSNDVVETTESTHKPVELGFQSIHPKAMHACGHDAHLSMALALAKFISTHKDELKGTFRLILQPAEEGVRGAKAMLDAGVVDDADYFFGMHIGLHPDLQGKFACMNPGFLATTKIDAHFTGYSSHAGGSPELGKNALLAACTAALNIQGISRHSKGASRINVGVLEAGTGRNVIPDRATLKIETRGETTEINEYIKERTLQIINGAAAMYDITVTTEEVGAAPASVNSEELAKNVQSIVKDLNIFTEVPLVFAGGGSEDCAYFMERVMQNGGQATYMVLGTHLPAPHHNPKFDIDEEDMVKGVATLGAIMSHYLK